MHYKNKNIGIYTLFWNTIKSSSIGGSIIGSSAGGSIRFKPATQADAWVVGFKTEFLMMRLAVL